MVIIVFSVDLIGPVRRDAAGLWLKSKLKWESINEGDWQVDKVRVIFVFLCR